MRIMFFVLATALLAGCTNSGSVPAGIIPSQKMETILWQLMQSDEYVNIQLAKDSLKKASIEKMKIYQQVFDLNGTSLEEFKKSYQYYMAHPDIAKIMFDSITAKAGRQRADIYKTKPAATSVKPDTLTPKPAVINLIPVTLKPKPATVNLTANKLALRPDTVKHTPRRVKRRLPKKISKGP